LIVEYKVKDLLFPYYPTAKEVEKFYEDGNGFFDKMNDEEKADFCKKDTSLPLGL
jgi:hypothetical protein